VIEIFKGVKPIQLIAKMPYKRNLPEKYAEGVKKALEKAMLKENKGKDLSVKQQHEMCALTGGYVLEYDKLYPPSEMYEGFVKTELSQRLAENKLNTDFLKIIKQAVASAVAAKREIDKNPNVVEDLKKNYDEWDKKYKFTMAEREEFKKNIATVEEGVLRLSRDYLENERRAHGYVVAALAQIAKRLALIEKGERMEVEA